MSSNLYLTPTRRRFLDDIQAGDVLVDPYGQAAYTGPTGTTPDGGRCTAKWEEADRQEWAYRPPGDEPRWQTARLTEAGRKALDHVTRPQALTSL
jgi:hypothetical protein